MDLDFKVKPPSEAQEQMALVKWLDANGILFIHVMNETAGAGKKRGGMNKLMGVKKGFPDILIFPFVRTQGEAGIAIEMKAKNGKTTKEQEKWLVSLRCRGWITRICYGAHEAIEWLEELGY